MIEHKQYHTKAIGYKDSPDNLLKKKKNRLIDKIRKAKDEKELDKLLRQKYD